MLRVLLYLLVAITFSEDQRSSCPPKNSFIEQILSNLHIPGLAIAVVNRTHILYKQGFGYTTPSDVSQAQPIDPDRSIFLLASISKTFVGVATMQLVESGQIDLDANINDYLSKDSAIVHPIYPSRSITMRHLLSHTSSIGPNYEKEPTFFVSGDGFTEWDIENVVKEYVSNQSHWLSVPPGTNVSYSNIGTTLAALVIEKVVNMRYEEYIFRRILQPLGLQRNQASYRLSDFGGEESQLVEHYVYNASLLNRITETLPGLSVEQATGNLDWVKIEFYSVIDYPAGLLRMSLNSLSMYFRSFLNDFPDLLLYRSSTSRMIELVSGRNSDTEFGLGWYWQKLNGTRLIGHRGGMPTVVNRMFANENRTLGIILLSSADSQYAGSNGRKIRESIDNLLIHVFSCFE